MIDKAPKDLESQTLGMEEFLAQRDAFVKEVSRVQQEMKGRDGDTEVQGSTHITPLLPN